MIKQIQECFGLGKVLFTKHAKDEMEDEEFGEIKEREVFEAVLSGKIIETYSKDEPYPSYLIMGGHLEVDRFMLFVPMQKTKKRL